MFQRGIWTEEQYAALGERRRYSGARAAYNLLAVGDDPSPEQIRIFEDVSFTLQTSNGTFRTTFRNRFEDVDSVAVARIRQFLGQPDIHVQDRAVSHGLTAAEFAKRLLPFYAAADFEASDLLVELFEVTLDSGDVFIAEPSGAALQYISPPWVVGLSHPEARRLPINGWIASRAKRKWQKLALPPGWSATPGGPGYRVRAIPFVHPEARALARTDPRFRFRVRSVFDTTAGECDVVRTMNILNLAYFSKERLQEGIRAVFDSLKPGGIWVVGKTTEEEFRNHATIFRRHIDAWERLDRIGNGSEIEELALTTPVKA